MMKKALLISAAAVAAWWIYSRNRSDNYLIETDGYSSNTGGFVKAAFDIASGDYEFMTDNTEMNFSTAYFNLVQVMENGIKKGWDAKLQKWFVHLDSQSRPTIAYGHLMRPIDNFESGLTEAQALQLLVTDIDEHAKYVRKNIKIKLSQNEFDAVTDFVYNAGAGSLLGTGKFSKAYGLNPANKFNKLGVKAGFDEIAKHYDTLAGRPSYANSARGLLNRKAMQQRMAFDGVYKLS